MQTRLQSTKQHLWSESHSKSRLHFSSMKQPTLPTVLGQANGTRSVTVFTTIISLSLVRLSAPITSTILLANGLGVVVVVVVVVVSPVNKTSGQVRGFERVPRTSHGCYGYPPSIGQKKQQVALLTEGSLQVPTMSPLHHLPPSEQSFSKIFLAMLLRENWWLAATRQKSTRQILTAFIVTIGLIWSFDLKSSLKGQFAINEIHLQLDFATRSDLKWRNSNLGKRRPYTLAAGIAALTKDSVDVRNCFVFFSDLRAGCTIYQQ